MPHPIFSLLAQSHDKCLRTDSVELGKRRLAKSRSASAASPDETNVFKAASPSLEATGQSRAQESAFQHASEVTAQEASSATAQTTFCPIEMDSIRADSIVLARARGVSIHKKIPSSKSVFHVGGVSSTAAHVFAFPRRARPNSAQPGTPALGMFEARSCPPTAEGNRYRRRASESESYEADTTEKHHSRGAMGLVDFIKRHFGPHTNPEHNPRPQRSASSHATPGGSRTASPLRDQGNLHDTEGRDTHGTEKGRDAAHGSSNWFSRVSGKMSRKSIEPGSGVTSPKQNSSSQTPATPLLLNALLQSGKATSSPERSRSPPLHQPQQQQDVTHLDPTETASNTDDISAAAVPASVSSVHGSALPQVAK